MLVMPGAGILQKLTLEVNVNGQLEPQLKESASLGPHVMTTGNQNGIPRGPQKVVLLLMM
jgi:hypothetical protein